ncbi:MAG: hypothetical protein P0120_22165 [Nitrospira sp.]|nr:hypothetical protein [Nitrospira sp.]
MEDTGSPRARFVKRSLMRLGGMMNANMFDELGRNATRSSFPGWIPRAVKRKSGRTDVQLVPAHIRMLGVDLSKEQRASIRQTLSVKLGKFANSIERVSVRVEDVNGPRSGIDHVCRIKVVLSGLPSVVYEAQGEFPDAAIRSALVGTERAVRRSLNRRRKQPIKVGARSRTSATRPPKG